MADEAEQPQIPQKKKYSQFKRARLEQSYEEGFPQKRMKETEAPLNEPKERQEPKYSASKPARARQLYDVELRGTDRGGCQERFDTLRQPQKIQKCRHEKRNRARLLKLQNPKSASKPQKTANPKRVAKSKDADGSYEEGTDEEGDGSDEEEEDETDEEDEDDWSEEDGMSDYGSDCPLHCALCLEVMEAQERVWAAEEKISMVNYHKKMITFVDTVVKDLETSMAVGNASEPSVGGLQGHWKLFNLEVVPEASNTPEYFTFFISTYATTGELTHPMTWDPDFDPDYPMEHYMSWQLKDNDGAVLPFQLPEKASLAPIPVTLSSGKRVRENPAEIVFLGSDCMRLRVRRALVLDNDGWTSKGGEMMEFAGIRVWEKEGKYKGRHLDNIASRKRF